MDCQLTKLIQRIQQLSVNERQPIIKYLDDLDRTRPRSGLTSASQSSSEDRQLIDRINHFEHLNKTMGPVRSDLTTAEGRAEYNDLLRKFHDGTISQLELELLWILDYRFSRCSTRLSRDYRQRMNIPINANGSRGTSNQAKQYYESTPKPRHR